MRYTARLRAGLVLGVALLAGHHAALASNVVPLEIVGDRFAVVQVSVNGQPPVPFLLDTGSTLSIVDRATARRLGLADAGNRRAVTHTDAREIPLVGPVSLRLGPVEARHLTVFVMDVPVLMPGHCRVNGVLGQDLLARTSYLIDYRNATLRIDTDGLLATELLGTRVSLRITRGFPAVRAEVLAHQDDGMVPLDLALDSGAASLTVFEGDRTRDERLAPDVTRRPIVVRSMHGSRLGLHGDVRGLVVGTERLAEVPLTLLPRPEGWGSRTEAGLLPTSLFDAVFVDNRARFVIFNPVSAAPAPTDDTVVPPLKP